METESGQAEILVDIVELETPDLWIDSVRGTKRKRAPYKKGKKTEITEDEIISACSLCNQNPDPLVHIPQNLYDKRVGEHMLNEHKIETDVVKAKAEEASLDLGEFKIPEKRLQLNGEYRLHCPRESCQATFGSTKLHKFKMHQHHHRLVDNLTPNPQSRWPCPDCDADFHDYDDWLDHRNKNHSKYHFPCRYPNCKYTTHDFRFREYHWRSHISEGTTPVCEICGKKFQHLKSLRQSSTQSSLV